MKNARRRKSEHDRGARENTGARLGFDEMLPQIEQIILNNRILNSPDVSLDEEVRNNHAIARGVTRSRAPRQMGNHGG